MRLMRAARFLDQTTKSSLKLFNRYLCIVHISLRSQRWALWSRNSTLSMDWKLQARNKSNRRLKKQLFDLQRMQRHAYQVHQHHWILFSKIPLSKKNGKKSKCPDFQEKACEKQNKTKNRTNSTISSNNTRAARST